LGSGAEAVHETVDHLNRDGAKVGVVKVRLYRPFDSPRFGLAIPATTRAIAVLDPTKEPGSAGEPLYLDCVNALFENGRHRRGEQRVNQIHRRKHTKFRSYVWAQWQSSFDDIFALQSEICRSS
jgi:pyruvate-ferredoxin/flavodoxin oxidoreductase